MLVLDGGWERYSREKNAEIRESGDVLLNTIFRFTAKLIGGYRAFPYDLCPSTCIASPIMG